MSFFCWSSAHFPTAFHKQTGVPSDVRSLWTTVPAPMICIPAYECFSLRSVGSGKRLSVHGGIVRTTSWGLFLSAAGLWTESDSFLCCIFSPLVFRTSIAQCSISFSFSSLFFSLFFFYYFLPENLAEDVVIWRKKEKKRFHLSKFSSF